MQRANEPVTLWGDPCSFYAGKTRAYLIKKGIPYRELNPSHPRYMGEVLPRIGHFAVPVVEFADGTLIQDSTDTIMHFEALLDEPALIPEAPVQQAMAWSLGCLGSEMWRLGLHYRWTYLEEHRAFIEDNFGRGMSQARNKAERRAAALPLMEQFSSKLVELGVNAETVPAIEAAYEDLLDRMTEHLFHHPYLLGGKPTLADFGFIAPFFAHLSRDPFPSNHMKNYAPSVYRWTERMFEQGFADAEFPDTQPEYPPDDTIPETTLAILENMLTEFSAEYNAMIDSYNAWCDAQPDRPAGTVVQDPDEPGTTHPSLGWIEFEHRGVRHRRRDSIDIVYHLQRVFDVIDALQNEPRTRFDALIENSGGTKLINNRLRRRLAYRDFRYVLA